MQTTELTPNVTPDPDASIDDILLRCGALLEQMDDLLLGFDPLAPDEAAHLPKLPGDGGDAVVWRLADQCIAIDLTRIDAETSVAGMLESLRRARALREIAQQHELVLARLRAARLRCEAASWRDALTFYALLRRAGAREPGVKARLEPIATFFRKRARGRRRGG